jgi:hypothetical protein
MSLSFCARLIQAADDPLWSYRALSREDARRSDLGFGRQFAAARKEFRPISTLSLDEAPDVAALTRFANALLSAGEGLDRGGQ